MPPEDTSRRLSETERQFLALLMPALQTAHPSRPVDLDTVRAVLREAQQAGVDPEKIYQHASRRVLHLGWPPPPPYDDVAPAQSRVELDDLPAELVDAIEDVYRQADVFAKAPGPIPGGLMPSTGSAEERLAAYNRAFTRLRMKLEVIPSAIDALREIDRQAQPRLYRYLVTLYLDVLKYDIDNASQKSGLRRLVERSWKRLRKRDERPEHAR